MNNVQYTDICIISDLPHIYDSEKCQGPIRFTISEYGDVMVITAGGQVRSGHE